jgi:hypothetical protein
LEAKPECKAREKLGERRGAAAGGKIAVPNFKVFKEATIFELRQHSVVTCLHYE